MMENAERATHATAMKYVDTDPSHNNTGCTEKNLKQKSPYKLYHSRSTSTNFRQSTHMVPNIQNVSLWKDNPNLNHSRLIVAERIMIFKDTYIL